MAMTINTNIVSINAQRNLGLSGSALSTSMQRLSSGLRVNSAKDDAAGLAIAERMTTQVKGLTVAARNANDGISLAQTAEGALGKVGDMLQRMRELAVQSANATNSTADREALQAEVSQMRAEIDRVAKTTSFNGQKILDGSFAGGVFQVGAVAGDNITVAGTTKATADALGNVEYGSAQSKSFTASEVQDLDKKLSAVQIQVGNESFALEEIKTASTGQERLGQIVAAINAKTADTGVSAFLEKQSEGVYQIAVKSDSDKTVTFKGLESLNKAAAVANVGVKDYSAEKVALDAAVTAASVAATTTVAQATELKANVVKAAEDLLKKLPGGDGATPVANSPAALVETALNAFRAASGTGAAVIPAAGFDGTTAGAFNTAVGTLNTVITTQVAASKVSQDAYSAAAATVNALDTDSSFTSINAAAAALRAAQGGTAAGMFQTQTTWTDLTSTSTAEAIEAGVKALQAAVDPLGINIAKVEVQKHVGIDELNISTQAGAWEAIKQIDSSIDQVNSARAALGALQTRFEKAIENIDIMNENITAARGRIVDADFAQETANLSRSQILQQAGTAMVAQANQLPQNVLSLLR